MHTKKPQSVCTLCYLNIMTPLCIWPSILYFLDVFNSTVKLFSVLPHDMNLLWKIIIQ